MSVRSCTTCNTEGKRFGKCGKCRLVYYCSTECQHQDWDNHKTVCFDRERFKIISRKLQKKGLIRHVNGNTLDNRIKNLQRVTVVDSFVNKDWTVDAVCYLNDKDFEIWERARAAWTGDSSWF